MTPNNQIHFKESEIYIAFCDESKNKKRFTENLTISKKKTKSYINNYTVHWVKASINIHMF